MIVTEIDEEKSCNCCNVNEISKKNSNYVKFYISRLTIF